MAERSEELRAEIEETRGRMGETVDALAYKADVPTRTKEWIGEKKDALTGKVSEVSETIGEATPDADQVKVGAGRVKRTAERNPLGLAIGGAAVGFIAGLLAPSTRVEDEKLGPMADEVKSTAAEAGREAIDRGKHVAQEAGESALETAKDRGREESDELTASLQDKVRDVASIGSESEPRGGGSQSGAQTGVEGTRRATSPSSQTGGTRSSG